MAQTAISPQKINRIYELFKSGSMISEIVAELGTNRETVRKYLLKKYTPEQKRAIVKRNFRQLKGPQSPSWKGGRQVTKEGYVRLWRSRTEAVLEHRQVMGQHLGRKLAESEVVHHINGKNADNRIANLQLTTFSEDISRHNLARYKNNG